MITHNGLCGGKAASDKFIECPGAMGEALFGLRQHFAKSYRMPIRYKHRIVAKAMGAAGRPSHTPGDASLNGFDMPIGPTKGKGANKMGASMSFGIISPMSACGKLIFGSAHRQGKIPPGPGPSCGINAGGRRLKIRRQCRYHRPRPEVWLPSLQRRL